METELHLRLAYLAPETSKISLNKISGNGKVVTKSEGTCMVIGSDQHARGIPARPHKAYIEKYQLKSPHDV